jgi:hypothetical protein
MAKALSADNSAKLAAFIAAQGAYLGATGTARDAESARVEAFRVSAIAASVAREGGITLARMAEENGKAFESVKDSAPRGVLYTSLSTITAHAYTGDVLRLPVAEGAKVKAVSAFTVQINIGRTAKVLGLDPIKAALKVAKTQQEAADAMARLADEAAAADKAAKAAKAAKASEPTKGTDTGAAEETQSAPTDDTITVTATVVTLNSALADAVAMVRAGERPDADALASIRELAALLAPVRSIAPAKVAKVA